MGQSRMNQNVIRLITAAAWLAIFAIAYATLTRVGFVYGILLQIIADLDASGDEDLRAF